MVLVRILALVVLGWTLFVSSWVISMVQQGKDFNDMTYGMLSAVTLALTVIPYVALRCLEIAFQANATKLSVAREEPHDGVQLAGDPGPEPTPPPSHPAA